MAGFFQQLFHPGAATGDAMDILKQYFQQGQQGEQQAQQQFQPYMDRGNQAGGSLMDFIQQLGNPEQLENQWASGYNTSPYAKQMLSQNQSQGMDAASQMGLMGSSSALQNIQNTAGNIVQGDRQNYMNDLFQKLMGGAGVAQNVYGVGANATGQNASMATQQADQAMNFGDQYAGLQYQKDQAPMNAIGQLLTRVLQPYLTGGFGQGSYGRGAFQPTANASGAGFLAKIMQAAGAA